jgi:GH35 family endo-1,4-beta-xylanase
MEDNDLSGRYRPAHARRRLGRRRVQLLVAGVAVAALRRLGVDVAVTEFDVRIQLPITSAKLAQQASDFSTVVKDGVAGSACPGVSQWGVGNADSWIPGAFPGYRAPTIYDQSYQPKPAYTAVPSAL